MDWMTRFSFYRRIQLSFIVFILLPFVVTSFWWYHSVKQNVSDKMTRSNEETLRVIANQITKTIDNISFISVYFSQSYNANLLESLRYLQHSVQFENYETYMHYSRLKTAGNIVSVQSLDADLWIFIVNRDNRIIMSNTDPSIFNEIEEPFLGESLKLNDKETTTLQWFAVKEDVAPSYYYAARVIADPRNHERLATLFIGIPDTYFHSLLDTGNDSVHMTLADKAGNLIASNGNELAHDSEKKLTGEVRIPRVDWLLANQIPQSSISDQINREFLVSISVISSFFAVFLFVSMLWAGKINKPISLLRSSVKQYVGGNRHVRMPVKGKDEVALLSTVFNQMLDDINQLLHQVEAEQEERRLLELQALVAQIRPHFLLNTLNSIKVNLLLAGDQVHGGMIDSLMTLLRAYVRMDEPIELAGECKILGSYIEVMQIRNRMKIRFAYRIEKAVEFVQLPRLLLQPIVENAIIHGFSLRPDHPVIGLEARYVEGALEIRIDDNGRGMSNEALLRLNQRLMGRGAPFVEQEKGVGLINTIRRLQVVYGPRASLSAMENPGGGLVFVLYIPMITGKEEAPDAFHHAD